jgi:FKBP-type peptidyl-prolyl cis-trans isomerase
MAEIEDDNPSSSSESTTASFEGTKPETKSEGLVQRKVRSPLFDDPEFVEVIPGTGLKKKILQEGNGDPVPIGAKCFVNYEGRLEDGTVFDSQKQTNYSYVLGSCGAVRAWEETLSTFRKGEKAIVISPPEYAYGELGCPPRIPPRNHIIWEMELERFEISSHLQTKPETIQEALKRTKKLKDEGNDAVKSKFWRKASKSYNKVGHSYLALPLLFPILWSVNFSFLRIFTFFQSYLLYSTGCSST